MKLVEQDLPAAVQNGGRRIRGVWLQMYRCQICKHSFLVVPSRHLQYMMDGTRCMRCGTLNEFHIALEPRLPNAFRATCKKCEARTILEIHPWLNLTPFNKDARRILKHHREKPKGPCLHQTAAVCEGRCARATRLLKNTTLSQDVIMEQCNLRREVVTFLASKVKRPARRYSMFDADRARRLHKWGLTDRAIAMELSVSRPLIVKWRLEAKLPAHRKLSFPPKQFFALRKKGLQVPQIAKRMGLKPGTLYAWLRRCRIDVEDSRRLGPDQRTPAPTMARVVKALQAAGYPKTRVGTMLGVSRTVVGRWLASDRQRGSEARGAATLR